jgi:uncharacterized LabA/DUF88 family protein
MYEGGMEEQQKVTVLIDYENVAMEAATEGKVVDFAKLAELCRSFGEVMMILFVPDYRISDALFETARENGFFIMATPSRIPTRDKQYRNADTIMIDYGTRMAEIRGVGEIVIVSDDADFITLVNRARDGGKKVALIATKNVSHVLEQVVNLEKYPLPMTNS